MYIGYLVLKGQVKGIQVFFDDDFNEDEPRRQFFVFSRIDEKSGKERYMLINCEEILYLEYWKDKE